MPGENCAIFGFSASRRNKGISFFKIPLPNNEANKKWGSELINIITKDREIDAALKSRIETRKLFICEQHFTQDQYYTYNTRKSLKEDELPKPNLPIKSFTTPTTILPIPSTLVSNPQTLGSRLRCQLALHPHPHRGRNKQAGASIKNRNFASKFHVPQITSLPTDSPQPGQPTTVDDAVFRRKTVVHNVVRTLDWGNGWKIGFSSFFCAKKVFKKEFFYKKRNIIFKNTFLKIIFFEKKFFKKERKLEKKLILYIFFLLKSEKNIIYFLTFSYCKFFIDIRMF